MTDKVKSFEYSASGVIHKPQSRIWDLGVIFLLHLDKKSSIFNFGIPRNSIITISDLCSFFFALLFWELVFDYRELSFVWSNCKDNVVKHFLAADTLPCFSCMGVVCITLIKLSCLCVCGSWMCACANAWLHVNCMLLHHLLGHIP